MGFAPAVIDQMTVWEFMACSKGYVAAHGGGRSSGGDLSEDDLREMGVKGF